MTYRIASSWPLYVRLTFLSPYTSHILHLPSREPDRRRWPRNKSIKFIPNEVYNSVSCIALYCIVLYTSIGEELDALNTLRVSCEFLDALLWDEALVIAVLGSNTRGRDYPGSALIINLLRPVEGCFGLQQQQQRKGYEHGKVKG
jgi:hypothetical protein